MYIVLGGKIMLAKIWKKLLMLILIIACLFNIVIKIVNNLSIEDELLSSAKYVQQQQDQEKMNSIK